MTATMKPALVPTTESMVQLEQPKFSIFNPVITFEHREFYERIIAELSGIFPICNQGKCTAVEISENVTEQEQITDLMKKVENFSFQLLGVTKRLFDQFYQAKEDFCESIYSTTAYIKINLLDRNLLERTCDVRWWSLESAFADCLSLFTAIDNQLAKCATLKVSETADADLRAACAALHELTQRGSGALAAETFREEFRTHITLLLGAKPKLRGDEESLEALTMLGTQLDDVGHRVDHACERLEDIINSYTLYRDLVITDSKGCIVGTANAQTRASLLGCSMAHEGWFSDAMATKDGTHYAVRDLCSSDVEPSQPSSLIYSAAVRENGDSNGRPLGAMGVFFDFQGEAKMILDDYMPRSENGQALDGWYSFFTDSKGSIIGSSDPAVVPVATYAHLPRRHRYLNKGERANDYVVFEGTDSAIFSARTDGYLEYPGLGWNSHLVVPKDAIFSQQVSTDDSLLQPDELLHSRIIPDVNKETYVKIQDDKESIQLISLKGTSKIPPHRPNY